MSFSVVIRCGRDWTPGDPCRQAEPLSVVDSFTAGRAEAARRGWSTVVDDGVVVDRCPACTRREAGSPAPVNARRVPAVVEDLDQVGTVLTIACATARQLGAPVSGSSVVHLVSDGHAGFVIASNSR